MGAWETMVRDLGRDRMPPLAQWLMAARPGQWVVVICETPKEKGNVQSRVNRIAITRGIRCVAKRLEAGVLVERL